MVAVVSYWLGEAGETRVTRVWLYENYSEAVKGMNKLWEDSYNLALEDEDFDESNSYHEENFAVVAWIDGLFRYFEVVVSSEKEDIL